MAESIATLSLFLGMLESLAGAPDFNVRERSTVCDPAFAIWLIHSKDPEVAHRYHAAAGEFYMGHLTALWDARGWPWIDSIPDVNWHGLLMQPSSPDNDWAGYKVATRIWARAQLLLGVPPGEVTKILLSAEAKCLYYRQHNRYPLEP